MLAYSTNAKSALRVHTNGAHGKFSVPHAQLLLDHGIYLLPFTADHLGGLGPFAHHFLFGLDSSPPPPFPPPPWTQPTNFPSNPAAFRVFSHALHHAPSHLLPRADSAWRSSQPPNTPPPCFGSTYHTHMPSQWASQALGLNLSLALATHLSGGLSRLLDRELSRRLSQQQASTSFRSTPFRAPPAPFLPPGPAFSFGDPDFPDPSNADSPHARPRVPSPRLPSPLPTLRVPARTVVRSL